MSFSRRTEKAPHQVPGKTRACRLAITVAVCLVNGATRNSGCTICRET